MVFEVLFSADVLLKRKYYAFLLGAFFSLVSIMLSIYLFPSNFIVFSIAFISLLLFPTISRLLELQKDIEKRGSRLDMNAFVREHKDILLVYILLFLGITAAFMAFSAISQGKAIVGNPSGFDFFKRAALRIDT